MEERYIRNIPAVSPAEQEALSAAKVVVVGCGGLGGYLIEYLGRMGVGTITAVDGDVFEPSNLNRQILSEPALSTAGARPPPPRSGWRVSIPLSPSMRWRRF